MASSDVEHWQCNKTLPQCMTYMLDNEIMCDVTFLLGEERQEVHAHKYMLASRSPVFHAMLEGPMAERGKIEIPDIEKDIFHVFLRYVYTDNVSVTVDNVLKVMYASKKYCVDLLTKQCNNFVKRNITNESACVFMDSALMLQEEDIYKSCLEKVKRNTESCVKSSGFTAISKETLKSITALDDIAIKEEVLFEQVMKWCDAECGRQQLTETWENRRKLLGKVIFNIRFPLMDSKYFAKEISDFGLLTDKEKVVIMNYFLLGIPNTRSSFNYKERCFGNSKKVTLSPTYASRDWGTQTSGDWGTQASRDWGACDWISSGKKDEIIFQTIHDSKLFGISLYSSYEYTVQITVKDSDRCIHNRKYAVSNSETEMHEIRFESPVNIEAHKSYRVELLMRGAKSRGKQNYIRKRSSDESSSEDELLIRGAKSRSLSRSLFGKIKSFDGQIPGLLLMKK
ncbi:hypothetical protein FSP39_013095 [Pinctada imbricata]|uniref:BTB domain-containing protein n=1 Tax=Pinctada imbricata TaxID=66713 RepID=A0AA89CCQ6_PINIB|nr:hypothetical protein FSP39_013095 [Pinctada imbricata]